MPGSRIITQTPIDHESFLKLVEEIETTRSWRFDSIVLGALVRMAYYAALKKGELIKIKVGDIELSDREPSAINVNGGRILLDDESRAFLNS